MNKKKFQKLRELNRKRNYFLKSLKFNFLKLFVDKIRRDNFISSDIKKVLFLRDDDKIGDMIVSTPVFRELNKKGIKLHVLSGKANYCVIESNPYIGRVYFYPQKTFAIIKLAFSLRKENFDLIIDMGEQIPIIYLLFIRIINAKYVIGFNKGNINTYSKSIKYLEYNSHITERYKLLLHAMDINQYNMRYDIHIPADTIEKVNNFLLGLLDGITVVINPFAAERRRDISREQLVGIVDYFKGLDSKVNIILIGKFDKLKSLSYLNGCICNPFGDFLSAVEIIKSADLIISPDTSIVHVAAAYEKNTIALYGNDLHGKFVNNDVWGPGNKNAVQLISKNGKISDIPLSDIYIAITDKILSIH
ncbi:glycosyltransferase family 9 protein [Photorhabdus akhurstii]|uniref:glycosyltransferase family 9 protein n=1 Tax=Photorhabdus akhurstii TaxID=171438 RepID=UPI0037043767